MVTICLYVKFLFATLMGHLTIVLQRKLLHIVSGKKLLFSKPGLLFKKWKHLGAPIELGVINLL